MNQKIETTKIRTNTFEELLTKARKWKNSGGEWKLLEYYWFLPVEPIETTDEKWAIRDNISGIKISNGQRELDISLEGKETNNFRYQAQEEINKVFPNSGFWKIPLRGSHTVPCKIVKEGNKELYFARYFNAWNLLDIFKLLTEYYQENKAKIDQYYQGNEERIGKKFSYEHWIKIENEPESDYLSIYIGEGVNKTKSSGGGEWEVVIKKSDLERYSTTDYEGNYIPWNDFNNQGIVNHFKTRINAFWVLLIDQGETIFDNAQVGFNDNFYKNNPVSSTIQNEEELVRKYMKKHDIYRISIDNGKLLIEYNNKKKKTLAAEGQELENILNCLEKQVNKSIIYEQSVNNNQPEKPNYPLWIGIGAVGVLIGVIITYFLVHKKRK